MWTKTEESHGSFAAFSQPSSACSYYREKDPVTTLRHSRGMKRPPDAVTILSEPR